MIRRLQPLLSLRSRAIALAAALLLVGTAARAAGPAGDRKAPTTPTNLTITGTTAYSVSLTWGASTDDVTSAQFIRYDISVNGQHIDSTSLGYTRASEYGIVDGPNTFEVVAVDEAGNASAPSSVTLDLFGCFVP